MAKKLEMRLFDCIVQHGAGTQGFNGHQIPKKGITEKELILLRDIHGPEAIAQVKEVGKRDADEQEEMYRLARDYSSTADPMSGVKRVERVFSYSMHGYGDWLSMQTEMEQEAKERREDERQAALSQKAA
jgi:hypothetical protein